VLEDAEEELAGEGDDDEPAPGRAAVSGTTGSASQIRVIGDRAVGGDDHIPIPPATAGLEQ